ncbi:hypothetical protein [Selenihalanaerobacter shriftii]|uniref:Polymer-forming protein n=1 Tax=Selenihalanaerobacter shriftii TaxID=142842 RepID=A0A1T4LWL6_9FIRM|nr:hypothetical protein [Selenihalanaerobacter shriftii]SJZ59082.1 hypothetical protein SAMN02745118_01278 [Selenihalanaerobacter shriftii]
MIIDRIQINKITLLLLCIFVVLFINCNIALANDKLETDNLIKHGNVKITADQIVENVIVVGGKVSIAGTIQEDVVVLGGDLEIKPSAIILGNIGVIGGKVKQSPEAKVTKNIFNLELSTSDFDILLVGLLLLLTFMFTKYLIGIILFLMSILLNLTVSSQIKSIGKTVSTNLIKSSLLGALGLLLMLLLVIISAISIIGSIISLLLLIVIVFGIILGLNGIAWLIGEKIAELLAIKIDKDITVSILGMSLLILFWFIPILGGLFLGILAILGFGAVIYNILPLR